MFAARVSGKKSQVKEECPIRSGRKTTDSGDSTCITTRNSPSASIDQTFPRLISIETDIAALVSRRSSFRRSSDVSPHQHIPPFSV